MVAYMMLFLISGGTYDTRVGTDSRNRFRFRFRFINYNWHFIFMNLNLISDGTYDRRPGSDPRISGFCCSQLLPGGSRLLSTQLHRHWYCNHLQSLQYRQEWNDHPDIFAHLFAHQPLQSHQEWNDHLHHLDDFPHLFAIWVVSSTSRTNHSPVLSLLSLDLLKTKWWYGIDWWIWCF